MTRMSVTYNLDETSNGRNVRFPQASCARRSASLPPVQRRRVIVPSTVQPCVTLFGCPCPRACTFVFQLRLASDLSESNWNEMSVVMSASRCASRFFFFFRQRLQLCNAAPPYIHVCDDSFFEGTGIWSGVFFVSSSVWDSLNWNFPVKSLRSRAVFGGRLQLPSPCLIRSETRRERGWRLSEISEKWQKCCVLRR